MFCDLGTPKAGWNVYDELRAQLTARGMPRAAIRYIHEAVNDQQKGELFAACRAGKVAVLIGTTAKMGVGTNVQARAVAEIHMDAPWRPADVAQREGRILRQGNLNEKLGRPIQIIRFVTEQSFDGYMWQTLERKARFIAQIMRGRLDVREIEDIGDAALSYNEVKALATGNPLLIDKAEADADLTKLERAERAHHRNQDFLRHTITRCEQRAGHIERMLPQIDQAIARRRDTRGEAFSMTVDGHLIRKRADAGMRLKDILQREAVAHREQVRDHRDAPRTRTLRPGELGGFTLAAEIRSLFSEIKITLSFPDAPETDLHLDLPELAKADPGGLIIKLENRLRGLEEERARLLAEQDKIRAEGERAAADAGKPFAQSDALAAARHRVQDITEQLEEMAAESARQERRQADEPAPDAAAGTGQAGAAPPGPAASEEHGRAGSRPGHGPRPRRGAGSGTARARRGPRPAAARPRRRTRPGLPGHQHGGPGPVLPGLAAWPGAGGRGLRRGPGGPDQAGPLHFRA